MTGPDPHPAPLPESPPLVVVSNRLPFRAQARLSGVILTRSPGGLVAALDPVLNRRGGVWVGWSGVAAEDVQRGGGLPLPTHGLVRYEPVPLSAHDVTMFYAGFANRTLWPLFHYFVSRTRIDDAAWRAYERVNERFARAAAHRRGPDSMVWVHDYQLLRVPHYLRRIAPQCPIAFFLHVPFPAADVFRILPWARPLLRGMLAADLVGFHVPSYAQHFCTCAERLLGCEVNRAAGIVYFEGREVTVESHPIGIDAALMERLAAQHPARAPGERVAEILGVDRLDYTKGIHERLLAVERLLERYSGYRGKVAFTQVLVPSRERVAEYTELKRELDETVGRINGRFSERGWSPIRYLFRSLPPDELAGLYRQSDVALVTPLRDGMNLVAKEYVAAQVDDDGVLILSELAGAADELQEAVSVNPFDVEAVATALHRALSMPVDERRARMSALRERVRGNDVHRWVGRFLEAADRAVARARAAAVPPLEAVRRRLAPWLAERPAVALFLDYDGTLAPLAPKPADAVLSDGMREALEQAARTPNVDVVIVSGRGLADVRAMVGMPNLVYVGNHGFEIEGPGISLRHAGVDGYRAALDAAAADLDTLGVAGGWVERKGATLSYHVRETPDPLRAGALRRAEKILRRRRLRVTRGKLIVEGRPPIDWHKGQAVLHVLVQRHGAGWPAKVRALYVGDDDTDEDAFQSLWGIGRSICVAPRMPEGGTAADFLLPDPEAVLQLVRWIGAGAFAGARV